jgi:hypothetical protein
MGAVMCFFGDKLNARLARRKGNPGERAREPGGVSRIRSPCGVTRKREGEIRYIFLRRGRQGIVILTVPRLSRRAAFRRRTVADSKIPFD